MTSLATSEQGETKVTTTNNKSITTIPSTLTTEQLDNIKELRTNLGEDLPKLARDDLTMYRFLVARDWVVKDSEEMLRNHLVWRQERFPIPRARWQNDPMFMNGAIFPFGYDKAGRPVLVIRSGKFCPNERDLENCLAAAVSQIVELFRSNGGFSKMTIVYDRQDFSLSEK